MRKKQLLLLALTTTVCMTGCFDKYSTELSADEAKAICQAIISNSEREDFTLPSQYGIEAEMLYERGEDKSDVYGTLIINKEETFIYLDTNVKEGDTTEYTHSLYFLYKDLDHHMYMEGIDKDGEKKVTYIPFSSLTTEEAFNKAEEKVSTKGKDWIVQTSVLKLLVDDLLIDSFVKGLHIAENLPDLSFIEDVKKLGLNNYECSMTSDGELNINLRYKFALGDVDTDISASWKEGYLYEGDVFVKDTEGINQGSVKQISIKPFKPDTTGYIEIIHA